MNDTLLANMRKAKAMLEANRSKPLPPPMISVGEFHLFERHEPRFLEQPGLLVYGGDVGRDAFAVTVPEYRAMLACASNGRTPAA